MNLEKPQLDSQNVKIIEDFNATIKPLNPIGAEIYGIDLKKSESIPKKVTDAIEEEMANLGFIVFKNQKDLLVDDFLKASTLWGGKELHSTHGVHPQTPNQSRHIFRLSNDPNHGILGVGPQWHNDGSFIAATFSHAGYHIIQPAKNGAGTYFSHQALAYNALNDEEKEFWERLSSVNSASGIVHPLVHKHSISNQKSVWLHLGMTGAVIEKLPNKGDFRLLEEDEMKELFHRYNNLHNEGLQKGYSIAYEYEKDDCVFIDNLAVAHKASPQAHKSPQEQGLRIMHRSTVKGVTDLAPAFGLPQCINIDGPNPFAQGVWIAGGLGFRWDEDIHMQN